MTDTTQELSLWVLFAIGGILLAQSIFLFLHARKNGHNYWFWGLIALIQAPMPTLFYFLFVHQVWKRRGRKE